MRKLFNLIIVDDETIEREGMTNLIPWEQHGISIAGSAGNGVEGYEMIKNNQPDIVLTDIKMPVLNGIDLIRKTKEDFQDIIFVVLSGYGEYEYTSQAMELGVKYYILKPCDEEKIIPVMEKVKEEIQEKRNRQKYENRLYNEELKKLLPHAKEQFFRNILTKDVILNSDYLFYKAACIKNEEEVRLLVVRLDDGGDYVGKFVIFNILEELLGKQAVLLNTYVGDDVILLITNIELHLLKKNVDILKSEYLKFDKKQIYTAVSETGNFFELKKIYGNVANLFILGKYENYTGLLSRDLWDREKKIDSLIDLENIKTAMDYPALLLELKILFIKISLHPFFRTELTQICNLVLSMLLPEKGEEILLKLNQVKNPDQVYEYLVNVISSHKNLEEDNLKEWGRFKQILLAVYENISQHNLTLQWLAKDILFMNEDYLGRLFTKQMKQKFSAFITDSRLEIAKRLIRYNTDLLISDLAEEVGYPADAQYFSKVFKNKFNMTPSEYREYIIKLQKDL